MTNKKEIKIKQQIQQLNSKVTNILDNLEDMDNNIRCFAKNELEDTIDQLQKLSNTLAYVQDKGDQENDN